MSYGITESGFVKKSYSEIYDDIRANLIAALNVDVSQNPQGVMNVIVATFAERLASLWNVAEDAYYSSYPGTAKGTALDMACSLGGVIRKTAKKTLYRVSAAITSGEPLTILDGTQAAITQNNITRYVTAKGDTTISKMYANSFLVSCAGATSGQTVKVQLDSAVSVSITATGTLSTDNAALLSALQAMISEFLPYDYMSYSGGILIICTDYKNHVLLNENLTIGQFTGLFTFEDNTDGPKSYSGAIEIEGVLPSVGTLSCETTAIGRNYETDDELRERYYTGIYYRGCASASAIRAAILEVPGVLGCSVVENSTNSTVSSQPAHSVAPYIDVGTADLQTIGRAIYDTLSAGISTYGSRSIVVYDYAAEGVKTIYYSNPSTIAVYVKITLTDNGQSLPSDYEDLAKELFMQNVGSPTINEGVSLQRIAAEITSGIANVVYTEIECNTDGTSTYDLHYLTAEMTAKYTFALARITVATAD